MAIIGGQTARSNENYVKLNTTIENVIVEPNTVLIEIPEDINRSKAGFDIISDKLNPDIMYRIAKIGKNVVDSYGLQEGYYILLQPGLTLLGLDIDGKKYIIVEGHNIMLGSKELKGEQKQSTLINVN